MITHFQEFISPSELRVHLSCCRTIFQFRVVVVVVVVLLALRLSRRRRLHLVLREAEVEAVRMVVAMSQFHS